MDTSVAPAPPRTTLRRYDLDWLRVLAFGLLILFHTGMFFNHWTWHVKNNVLSRGIEFPMLFLSQWRMALLFMISGAGVFWALGKRSAGQFAAERTRRLLIPLVFSMFVIVPPQIYFERLFRGQFSGSYAAWYPSVFQFVPYQDGGGGGSFSWHHLWYLAYILPYSLLGLPLWLALRRPAGQRLTARWAEFFRNPLGLIGLPVAWHLLIELLDLPENNHGLVGDWSNHAHYFSLFFSGFVLCTKTTFWETLARWRRLTLGIGLVASVGLLLAYANHVYEPDGAWAVPFELLVITNSWCWLLTLFGHGYRHLQFSTPFLRYATDAIFPFYILHQTITVAVGYYLAPLEWPWGLKFVLLAVATFGGCFLIYHFLIRPFRWVRPLFGGKA
jgi:cbb3-type cytochrome oxidase subunit 3